MGKSKTTTQNVNQQETASSGFNNQSFLQELASQFQQYQQMQQQQQSQQQMQSGTSAQQQMQQMAQSQGIDAASQSYVDQMRAQALGGSGAINAGQFAPGVGDINALTQQLQNPFMQNVVGGVGQQFDQLRGQAANATSQQATAAGAFGGSRHGVAQGQRLGELDRAEGQQVGQLLAAGHAQAQQAALPLAQQQAMAPLQALMAQQQMLQGGLGPTGQVTSGTSQSQQAMQQQQMMDMLSNLLGTSSGSQSVFSSNQQSGQQSGQQNATSTVQGRTTNTEKQGLGAGLLGLGMALFGGPFGSMLGSALGFGGAGSTAAGVATSGFGSGRA
jgi:hypothetical protein